MLDEIAEISKDANTKPMESISFDADLELIKAGLRNSAPYKIHRSKKLAKPNKEVSGSIPAPIKRGSEYPISKLNNST